MYTFQNLWFKQNINTQSEKSILILTKVNMKSKKNRYNFESMKLLSLNQIGKFIFQFNFFNIMDSMIYVLKLNTIKFNTIKRTKI